MGFNTGKGVPQQQGGQTFRREQGHAGKDAIFFFYILLCGMPLEGVAQIKGMSSCLK